MQLIKGKKRRKVLYILLALITVFSIATFIIYLIDMNLAYERLNSYDVKTLNTEFGEMSFIDEGQGETVLISHGIFGGYDQGYISLDKLVKDDCKKISISRFGYPGSALPENPTPQNQAKVFKALLDELEVEKTYVLCTSAGGAAGIQFALKYPERTKGLILLSSGAPDKKRDIGELSELGMMGPPEFIVNNFPMWFCLKYFSPIFNSMLGSSNNDSNLLETMLPVKERRQGVIADTKVTNIDMTLNYDEYALEEISCPILVIHAKDDPMASYENTEKLLTRVNATTAIYDTGGHMIEGHDSYTVIKDFINKIS
ncbi:MAG: alpha/beta fold hydrolase [Acetobacterium sp.]